MPACVAIMCFILLCLQGDKTPPHALSLQRLLAQHPWAVGSIRVSLPRLQTPHV